VKVDIGLFVNEPVEQITQVLPQLLNLIIVGVSAIFVDVIDGAVERVLEQEHFAVGEF
jgi:hypothetical protein